MSGSTSTEEPAKSSTPVRGSLRLTVSTSSPQVTAGSDFSIFVVIQNPFDIPITIQQVQTHIPVELIDVNGLALELAQQEKEHIGFLKRLLHRIFVRQTRSGIAIAVGTDFDPTIEREMFSISTTVAKMEGAASVVGVQFNFPENPTPEELDALFRRIADYRKGLIPVTLQPGDSMVKQFVLRTRHWLLFTPLTHKFQIQVNYTGDGVDHTDTIVYEQNIRSTFGAIAIGSIAGATLGTFLKSLRDHPESALFEYSVLQALIASTLASVAVVVAFARKSSVQPIVSIEDFWGGVLMGFAVGFFGFDQFLGMFGGNVGK